MNFGLALSGGGIKAAIHIGILKALEENNIKIDALSGASSGSIVATLYAAGYTPLEIYKIFKKYSRHVKYVDIKNVLKLLGLSMFNRKFLVSGLNSGHYLEKQIKKFCKKKNIYYINDIPLPLLIPSVSLQDGKIYMGSSVPVKFKSIYKYESNVPIATWVRSSASFPGIFTPVDYHDIQLVDGGIKDNIPWLALKEIGVKKVLSIIFNVDINSSIQYNNIFDITERSINLLASELNEYNVKKSDFILKINIDHISLLDYTKIDYLYNLGYNETLKNIDKIKNFINK